MSTYFLSDFGKKGANMHGVAIYRVTDLIQSLEHGKTPDAELLTDATRHVDPVHIEYAPSFDAAMHNARNLWLPDHAGAEYVESSPLH